jgi:hypothetical protein
MKPKNTTKRLRFPSRFGVANGRRRAAMEPTDFARALALNRREQSLRERGFFPGEAAALAESTPVKGKHLTVVPSHVVVPLISNEKTAFKESVLLKKWGSRLHSMQRRGFVSSLPEGMALRDLTQLLVQTIRFFGRHYSPTTAESIALSYLSGARITSPIVPKELQRLREASKHYFFQVDSTISSRRMDATKLRKARDELGSRGFRIVKRKPSAEKK